MADSVVTIEGRQRVWRVSPSMRCAPSAHIDSESDESDNEADLDSSCSTPEVNAVSSSAWERLLSPAGPPAALDSLASGLSRAQGASGRAAGKPLQAQQSPMQQASVNQTAAGGQA